MFTNKFRPNTRPIFYGYNTYTISMQVNGGFPYISVVDGDYMRNGKLYLVHGYEGTELDLHYLENVLPYIHQLWGRKVYMETYVDDKLTVYSYDGDRVFKR